MLTGWGELLINSYVGTWMPLHMLTVHHLSQDKVGRQMVVEGLVRVLSPLQTLAALFELSKVWVEGDWQEEI